MDSLLFYAPLVTLIGIYAIMALALNVQFGYGGMINFGLVAFFGIGAYAYALCVLPPANPPYEYIGGFELPILVGVLVAGCASTSAAVLIGIPTLRLRGEYLAVVTFAFAELIRHLMTNVKGIGNGNRGLFGIPAPGRDLVPGREHAFFIAGVVIVALVLTFAAVTYFTRGAYGRSLLAIRGNEEVAQSIGKNSYGFQLRALAFSSFPVGVAGALYVWYLTILSPASFSVNITFTVWIAAVIGGVGSHVGAVVGTIVLIGAREGVTYLEISSLPPERLSSIQDAVAGLVLILILLFSRRGLLPRKPRRYKQPEPEPAPVSAPLAMETR